MRIGRKPDFKKVILDKSGKIYNPPTRTKIYVCGDIAFRRDIFDAVTPPPRDTRQDANKRPLSERNGEKEDRNVSRAKLTVQCLLLANADQIKADGWFWTGTFRENVTEYTQAIRRFQKFVRRLKIRWPDVKYICVPEIQEKRAIKYGHRVWHFHAIIWDCIGADPQLFGHEWWWVNGKLHNRDQAQQIRNPDRLSSYVRKYITKTTLKDVPLGRRSYFVGGKVIWPVVHTWADGEETPPLPLREETQAAYKVENDYCGTIMTYQYKMK